MAYIRGLANGKFQVCWRENARDHLGAPIARNLVQRTETFTDEKQATNRKVAVENEIERGHDPSFAKAAASKRLGEYARDYFDSLAGLITARTIDGYIALYKAHIADELGHRPVASIRVADIKRLRSRLLTTNAIGRKTDRSPKTAKQVLGVLKRILDVAVENEAIPANPALAVKASGSSAKVRLAGNDDAGKNAARFEAKPLTAGQIALVADYVERVQTSPVYALAIKFAAFSGLRAAELAGLQVADLNLSEHKGTAGQLHVNRTKTKRRSAESDGSRPQWITDTPKSTKSIRVVPIDAWLADDLRDYLADVHPHARDPKAPLFPGRLTMRAALARGLDTRDRVARYNFCEPIDCSNVYKRYLAPALQVLALPAARWHDLRHSFAVMSLSGGEHYMQVSKWLGHATFTLTLDTYGDYIASNEGGKAAPLARPVADSGDNVVSIGRRTS